MPGCREGGERRFAARTVGSSVRAPSPGGGRRGWGGGRGRGRMPRRDQIIDMGWLGRLFAVGIETHRRRLCSRATIVAHSPSFHRPLPIAALQFKLRFRLLAGFDRGESVMADTRSTRHRVCRVKDCSTGSRSVSDAREIHDGAKRVRRWYASVNRAWGNQRQSGFRRRLSGEKLAIADCESAPQPP